MAAAMSRKIKIGPSILNSNLANLAKESSNLLSNGADYLHLDVMDGHFVPNLTFGHPMVKCLRRELGQAPFFDVHMMVASPLDWIEPMADAGCTQYTYHFEAAHETQAALTSGPGIQQADNSKQGEDKQEMVIRKIKEAGMRVGLAIKPKTNVDCILPYIKKVDMVLIMTVEPGFGGQKFMSDMMSKVKCLRSAYKELDIEVDGGVGPETVKECCSAGANMIVSGTAITNSKEPKSVIDRIREIGESSYKW